MEEHAIAGVSAVLPCADIDDTVAFFQTLGFRLDAILPADDPAIAEISGHGLRLRLQREGSVAPAALPPLPATAWIGRADASAWKRGRAGMRYRDLVPDRQGGHLVASQIRIDEGGPVADYVHWHEVELQLIYCRRGWVRVVYEDQGPPFELHPGDCVLQPPRIRHRVLECSPGLEVIELGCPAVHETRVEHELVLPTASVRSDRDFHGQRFVRHERARAHEQDDARPGFVARDLGIGTATSGRAEARVLRRVAAAPAFELAHTGRLAFGFVLAGEVSLVLGAAPAERVGAEAAFVVPGGLAWGLADASDDLELLEIVLR